MTTDSCYVIVDDNAPGLVVAAEVVERMKHCVDKTMQELGITSPASAEVLTLTFPAGSRDAQRWADRIVEQAGGSDVSITTVGDEEQLTITVTNIEAIAYKLSPEGIGYGTAD